MRIELISDQKYLSIALLVIGQFLSSPLLAQSLPDNFFPESIAVSSNGRVFVGSNTDSSIVEIPAGATSVKPFIASGANGLMSVQGLLADDTRGILWACTADLGVSSTPKGPSALLGFHIENGSDAGRWHLPDNGFCNDLTFGSDGNLLITDTTHDRILSFDLTEKRLYTWIQHPALGGQLFNGNGIAVERNNVYVSTFSDGRLLRIPVKSDGSAGEPVVISLPRPLKGGDAIRTVGPNRLIIFENGLPEGRGQVTLALIENNQAVLIPITSTIHEPTSGVLAGDDLMIVESQFAKLYGAKKGTLPNTFSIPSIKLHALPSVIDLPHGPKYPNGIAVDQDGTLYTGFVASGLIFKKRPGNSWETFHFGSENIYAATSLRLDTKHHLLWGTSPDFLVEGRHARPNKIFALDTKTGASRYSIDLPDGSFGNDIALEPNGDLLITDSTRGRILRLEPETKKFTVKVKHPEFEPLSGETIGLSGIALASNGRLIVANYSTGKLLAIEQNGTVKPIPLPRRLANPDGLVFTADGSLILCEGNVESGNGKILRITAPFSETNRTIEILAEGLVSPVNLSYLKKENTILVTEAKIRHRLIKHNTMTEPSSFRILRLPLSFASTK